MHAQCCGSYYRAPLPPLPAYQIPRIDISNSMNSIGMSVANTDSEDEPEDTRDDSDGLSVQSEGELSDGGMSTMAEASETLLGLGGDSDLNADQASKLLVGPLSFSFQSPFLPFLPFPFFPFLCVLCITPACHLSPPRSSHTYFYGGISEITRSLLLLLLRLFSAALLPSWPPRF